MGGPSSSLVLSAASMMAKRASHDAASPIRSPQLPRLAAEDVVEPDDAIGELLHGQPEQPPRTQRIEVDLDAERGPGRLDHGVGVVHPRDKAGPPHRPVPVRRRRDPPPVPHIDDQRHARRRLLTLGLATRRARVLIPKPAILQRNPTQGRRGPPDHEPHAASLPRRPASIQKAHHSRV